jgi:hypothetical protein
MRNFERVRWVTPDQIAANQVIPLREPARRGMVNAATDVAAATNQAVAAAEPLRPTEHAPRLAAEGARVLAEPPPNMRFQFVVRRSITMSRAKSAASMHSAAGGARENAQHQLARTQCAQISASVRVCLATSSGGIRDGQIRDQ